MSSSSSYFSPLSTDLELPGAAEAYHYRDPRDRPLDDSGWGCVWRNAQTIIASQGHAPPSISLLMRWLGVPHTPSLPRAMWIEPHDAIKVIAPFVGQTLQPRLISFREPPTSNPSAHPLYEQTHDTVSFSSSIERCLRTGIPALVDDGVMSYCIFGSCMMGGEPWWVISDPHVDQPRRMMASRVFFDRSWMASIWLASDGLG